MYHPSFPSKQSSTEFGLLQYKGFFHQSACPRVERGPMERIKILHPATVTPESAGTRRPPCVIDR